ncbi:tyrosine-type recombinase/integrase [Paramaledivibacter caminithermalis]|jgi:site-specific recombinase XerD|uniref:Site-specific recombinase XerD n=1 Tax=Paramaledivibacter caminithermalis (strain DSM 15212 / CIP 107654 / DViRD3) TaxID=1121301 RepID=A0A1M6SEJ6_PARC5|nr:site-specific integrase [Paramaledivibacter caminithermalis]SHK43182.1 Site-specific recombinase XerD [Paramaledivibacter caminithermalis DSM 15212]
MHENIISYNSKNLIKCFTIERLKLEKTRRDYTREILKFTDFINKDFLYANNEDCSCYINKLKDDANNGKMSIFTVEKKYIYLFSFFNYIESVKLLYDFIPDSFYNHFRAVEKPSAPRSISSDKIVSFSELDKLISILKEGNLRDYTALMLIFTSGLTLRETIDLKWNNFIEDANSNIAIEFKVKNNEKRYVKVSDDMAELLAKYKKSIEPVNKDSHVFRNKFGKPLSGRWLRKILTDACKKAEFEHIYTPRDLRHSAAALCLKNGASAEKVKNQFGWSDARIADRYSYSIPVLEDNAIDYLNFKLK